MTRKEEIMEKMLGISTSDFNSAIEYTAYGAGFMDGAHWADRTMIDKACKFLKNANAAQAIVIRKGVYNMKEFSVIEFTDNFIEQFKKAMEQ